jgi:hypothetical protein
LILLGWVGALIVAAGMALVRGESEYAPAAVFAAIAVAMAVWVWRRRSRASAITSLVLGVLWTLQFGAYAAAGLVDEGFEADVFAVDVLAVVGGVLLVIGAWRGILEFRRDRSGVHAA